MSNPVFIYFLLAFIASSTLAFQVSTRNQRYHAGLSQQQSLWFSSSSSSSSSSPPPPPPSAVNESSDTTVPSFEERFQLYMKTYEAKNEEEIRAAYKAWAPIYEHHIQDQGYQAPELCANLLHTHLKDTGGEYRDLHILDVGAGTGLVGKALASIGYRNIDALDISADMLEVAQSKNVYQRVIVDNAAAIDSVPDNAFDAVICVGALNFGHIPAVALEEFLRIVKPSGLVAFSNRMDFYNEEGKAVISDLEAKGKWDLVERRDVPQAVKDMPHIHFCYRKTP